MLLPLCVTRLVGLSLGPNCEELSGRVATSREACRDEWSVDGTARYRRPDEECYHNPPMFLVGNCAVIYSGPTTRPAIRRTKFTVWRF